MHSTGCNCKQDTLRSAEREPDRALCPAKVLFHELTALVRSYASEYEQEAAQAAFYEHRALAGFSARGMLRNLQT